jgi:parallel beta-helix repeat protein
MYGRRYWMFRNFYLLLILLSCSPAWGATYYVDATGGTDSNAGTSPSNSWKNISKVNTFSFLPGDSILFKRGETWYQPLIIPSSGSSGNPITFGAYGSGNLPTINGNNTTTTLIQSSRKNHITISDLKVTNSKEADDGVIKIYQSSYNILNGLTVDYNRGYFAIWLIDTTNHTMIQNCTVSNQSEGDTGRGDGIIDDTTRSGGFNTVDNCDVFRNHGAGVKGNYWGSGLRNFTVKNSRIHNNGSAGIGLSGDGSTYPSNCLIENNEIYENAQSVDDTANMHIFQVGNNNIVRYNITHDIGYSTIGTGIFLDNAPTDHWGTGNQIYYNILYNEYDGITVLGAQDTVVYNNTIYNSGHIGLKVHGSTATGNTIKNNLIHTAATQLVYEVDGSNNTIDYNFYYDSTLTNKFRHNASTYSSLADWRTASGQDRNSPEISDPKFVSTVIHDFRLQSGSPVIDAGVPVSLSTDIARSSVPIGIAPDIGAFEYQENARIPSPPSRLIIIQ